MAQRERSKLIVTSIIGEREQFDRLDVE